MKHTLLVCSLLALLLYGAFALGEVPQWIQTEERLVGENSTQYADTLNRPGKTIWNNFLVEHDNAGFHNYSTLSANLDIDTSSKLDVSIFETEHTATGEHDFSATKAPLGEWVLYVSTSSVPHEIAGGTAEANGVFSSAAQYSIWAVVAFGEWGENQSIFKRSDDGFLLWDFGLADDNALYFTSGDLLGNTQTYKSAPLDYAHLYYLPTEVGVSFDTITDEIFFFVGGHAEAVQSFTSEPGAGIGDEVFSVGTNLRGWLYTLSVQSSWARTPGNIHTPLREGYAQCYKCVSHYDLDQAGSDTLTDTWYFISIPITGGTWEKYAEGY